MNAQQLKNAILQEAIEGRLVPQDPNDEPASALLARIRKEKEQLVKAGKLKKKDLEVKPISEDEKPFEIPESWEWCRVGDIIYPPKYGTSNKSSLQGEVAVLRMGNIQDGEIVFDKLVFSNNKADNDKYNLIAGDLLFNRTNSAELVGKTGIYRGQQKAIYAGYLILLRPIGTISDYLNYVLGSSYARSYCKEVKTIGVQQCNINAEKISTFVIPLPPLAEQKRIVAKIEELLPKVEEYGKAQDALNNLNAELPDRLKKSILQEAIEGRLVPQDPNDEPASVLLAKIRKEKEQLVKAGKLKKKDLEETPISEDEKPFDLPDSWEWVRHNDLFNISGGSQPPKSVFSLEEKDGYIRLYQIRDYGENPVPVYIPISSASKITQKGDILLARYGGSLGKVFFAEEGAYNVAMAKVEYLFNKQLLNNDYLFFYYKCNLYQDLVRGNNRSAQGGFNKEDLGSLLFPLPPLAEQKRIVAKIEELFAVLDSIKESLEA
jgi:type I restriction enzyme S subunit